MYKADGSLFIGKFENGKANGDGRYILKDGSYYSGLMKNNVAETQKGIYESKQVKYEGEFSHNTFYGNGEEKGENYQFTGFY